MIRDNIVALDPAQSVVALYSLASASKTRSISMFIRTFAIASSISFAFLSAIFQDSICGIKIFGLIHNFYLREE